MKKGDIIQRVREQEELPEGIKPYTEVARVNWVEDGAAGITYTEGDSKGLSNIVYLEEDKGWIVLISAQPTFQSSVASMSDEELSASIEGLRAQRSPSSLSRRPSRPSRPSRNKGSIAKKLDGMSPAELEELKRKLGL